MTTMLQTTWTTNMHSEIYADTLLRSVAIAVARNQVGKMRPLQDVLTSEGISDEEYQKIHANPMYQRYLKNYTKELVDSGFSFETKSSILAEDLLPIVYQMARDPDVPAATRAKLIEDLVDWGNLKPKTNQLAVSAGSGFSISINFPSDTPKNPLEAEAIDADFVEEVSDSEQEPLIVEKVDDMVKICEHVPLEEPSLNEQVHDMLGEPELKVYPVRNDPSLKNKLANIFDDDEEYVGEDFLE